MSKQTFIQGTLILLAAGIINRMLGFIPRIALPRIVGPEGVGLYQLGYPFFIVLVTIITGGIPLAIAKMVAEAEGENRPEESRRILRTGLALSLSLGILFTLVALFSASWVSSRLLTDSRVYYTFISMTPMISIVAVSSVYRGYFQGTQNMIPSALSSILESIIRIFFMLWFSWLLLPKGIAFAAAGAMLGVTVGEIAGLMVLLLQYHFIVKRDRKGAAELLSGQQGAAMPAANSNFLLKRLLGIAVPVTAGRLVGSFSYLLESIITARSLALAGITAAAATAQYGSLQGMVIPLLLLPGVLSSSLAVSLVPSLSEASARHDSAAIHKRIHQALRLALVTGAPFAAIMYIFAVPLCTLMYGNAETAPMLRMMAPFALFLYVQAPLQAVLQAMDRPGRALINTLIGAVVKITLILILASRPEYGIYGAIMAIIVNSILVTLLHGLSVVRLIKLSFRLSVLLKTLTAMIIMAAGMSYVYTSVPIAGERWLQFLISSVCGMAVYLGICFLTGLISVRDLDRLPFFKRRR
ncbi:stage V sporulation protein B [Paenibacillus sp. PK3_47]|uniref:stage V sporulation protein B n=1 Tax=Paenibacillus sp. PK3_47 TaxID=2072642 RepID=UPI00201D6F8B|nr:stage V sporulation protein B [Paenibacillus sp. PK3_47]UQZ37385.1 stage V sporulation protein B [Paenibacillus sp. PK3_47]